MQSSQSKTTTLPSETSESPTPSRWFAEWWISASKEGSISTRWTGKWQQLRSWRKLDCGRLIISRDSFRGNSPQTITSEGLRKMSDPFSGLWDPRVMSTGNFIYFFADLRPRSFLINELDQTIFRGKWRFCLVWLLLTNFTLGMWYLGNSSLVSNKYMFWLIAESCKVERNENKPGTAYLRLKNSKRTSKSQVFSSTVPEKPKRGPNWSAWEGGAFGVF